MFRFLTERYPLILQSLDEDYVFDNFYLDMNGIIHQCTHPDDNAIAILDLDSMFDAIFTYTDRLFRIVAPRKLMFLAIDGVAPRAKMNQQRSRRFRSAKDAERSMSEAVARGEDLPDGTPFDSNCITPGTQFMTDLSKRFREWVDEKMRTDPAWQQGCSVVFSGSEVPGEGEHKLVSYIRQWRNSPDYHPDIRHCMYGLDADLMMLGLVSHVPHFTLIREKMRFSKRGRKIPKLRGVSSDADEFHLLEISLLRDMLYLEFTSAASESTNALDRPNGTRSAAAKLSAELDGQRADLRRSQSDSSKSGGELAYSAIRIADDFVFMCMLVGNDFLPNVPHLDIADGALNIMFRIYKVMLRKWKGYLTDAHRLHPGRLEVFLKAVAMGEDQYFANRAVEEGAKNFDPVHYREQYYSNKLEFDIDSAAGQEELAKLKSAYMHGLHWCLQYYHQGVPSWNWFYPYFYAPLASDMTGLRGIKVSFQKGSPFSPITQLMAVLPPRSADFLPHPMKELMVMPESPVADFYPPDFETDMNGKRNSWEAIVLIPFIDEKRLLAEVRKIEPQNMLTAQERERDLTGKDHWFLASDYPRATSRVPMIRPSKFRYQSSSRSRGSRSSSEERASPFRRPRQSADARNGQSRPSRGRGRRGSGGQFGSDARRSSQQRNRYGSNRPSGWDSDSDGRTSGTSTDTDSEL